MTLPVSFTPAVRATKKARIAIYGASGSGKTYTSLSIASGLGERIALIDTERGSSQLYADHFKFDALNLTQHHPDNFIAAIRAAESAAYDVLIIDSLTHAWLAILDAVDATKGNTFTDGWGKTGTPLYNKLVAAILDAKLHVIVCMRSKTEYVVEEQTNSQGRSVKAPKKVGLAPVMRPDTEYEFDLVLTMDDANNATISKTRLGDLIPVRTNRPDLMMGCKIRDYLASGATLAERAEPATPAPDQSMKQSQAIPPINWKDDLTNIANEAKAQLVIVSERGDAILTAKLDTAIKTARELFAKNGTVREAEIATVLGNLKNLVAESKNAN